MGMNRGICQVCGYSWAVTKNGILLRHNRIIRGYSSMCAGVGRQADVDKPESVAEAQNGAVDSPAVEPSKPA